MNRDKLTPLQKVAYEQQASLLAHAHSQALKMLIEDRQIFKLSVDDALTYLNMAKIMLNEVEFKELLFLMSECSKDNCEIIHVLGKISNLLQGYPELLQGFGMFLPPDLNLQLQTGGLVLLNKVKTENGEPLPEKCEAEESMASSSGDDRNENVSKETNPSPLNTSDGVLEKKDPITIKEIDADFAKSYLNKVKERFHDEPQVFERFLELLDSVRNDTMGAQSDIENDVFLEVGELFRGQDDLIEEFKTFVPNAYRELQDEDVMDTSDKVPENSDENSLSQSDAIDMSKISIVNDPSIAPVYKFGSYEEHQFFDNVRSAVGHREVFDNFLRCLMLYNEDVITKSELLKLSTSFLGKFPNLHRQFKDILGFKESGENIETIPMKIISLENLRSRPEIGTDIDYSAGGRNGASYRALPKDFEQPKCSGRTALCKEVLNDTWVSFPSWSEDSTFVTSCKTQYEEIIYRCEDERFELDMAISANIYTLQILENVQKKINKMTTDEKSMFSLDDSLGGTSTVLQQRALHRLYGDKTEELVEGLKRNPLVAVPIILKRLKVKEDEWKEKELKFNDLWRNQIDHYYLKSLDHQGINFKQNDSKSFRPKSLLNEMEMVYAENKENHVNSAHFVLEFKEMDVFLDAINLMLQYLKKLTGVYRDDRRRIELVVRSFIPDFFGAPRATKSEEDMEVEEEIREPMEVENDGEERSAQNSSAGSNRDEGSSDQDESISNEENELSDEADKTFIEESDVFDKMDPLPVTNLPYALFLVSKTWFIFFRQFHILCERLSRLLFESNRKEIHVKKEEGTTEEVYVSIEKVKPSYKQLIEKLSQLLSGSIDYNQFEEEARTLFGIHAFVSFTMDKLVLTIVRQLQQIVADDICKQCTAFFIQHTKVISTGGHTSPLEASQIEYEYLRKVEKMMDDEQCFKVVWHKKDHTLTIELLEQETEENCPDPREAEKWSKYLDAYVTGDSCCEEIPFQHSPVILPRNLRKQLLYWKNKAVQVDKLWKTKQSAKLMKKHLPLSVRKRRALSALSPILRKMPRRSSAQEGSGVASNDANEPNLTEDNAEVQAEQDTEIPVDNTKDTEIAVDNTKDTQIAVKGKKDTDDSVMDSKDTVADENESDKSELIVIDLEAEPMCLQEESIVDVIDNSTDIPTKEVPLKSPKTVPESEGKNLDDAGAHENKPDPVQEVQEPMKVEDETEASTAEDEKKGIVDVPEGSTEEKKQEKNLFDENVLEVIGSEMDIHSRIEAIETAHRVMASINVENEKEENVVAVSDSDSIGKDESSLEKPLEKRPVKRRIIRKSCDYSIRTRKNRIHQSYVRRRMKRGIVKTVQSSKGKRRRQVKPKSEFFDDPNFDFMHFSELPENEKGSYLAFKYVTIEDEVEGAFRKGSYKIYFVQNCDLYVHRKNALTRAKEIHQAISEIKTSNFNAWHRIWLDRYVTPSMVKYCNDWLHKSDAEKFKLVRVTVSDCTKPPYIPYNKYRVRYYKVDT